MCRLRSRHRQCRWAGSRRVLHAASRSLACDQSQRCWPPVHRMRRKSTGSTANSRGLHRCTRQHQPTKGNREVDVASRTSELGLDHTSYRSSGGRAVAGRRVHGVSPRPSSRGYAAQRPGTWRGRCLAPTRLPAAGFLDREPCARSTLATQRGSQQRQHQRLGLFRVPHGRPATPRKPWRSTL